MATPIVKLDSESIQPVRPPPPQAAIIYNEEVVKKMETLKKLAISSLREVDQLLCKFLIEVKTVPSSPERVFTIHKQVGQTKQVQSKLTVFTYEHADTELIH